MWVMLFGFCIVSFQMAGIIAVSRKGCACNNYHFLSFFFLPSFFFGTLSQEGFVFQNIFFFLTRRVSVPRLPEVFCTINFHFFLFLTLFKKRIISEAFFFLSLFFVPSKILSILKKLQF